MKIHINGIEAFVEEADRYLQINDISAAGLHKTWQQIKTTYENYDKWFCYHNTEIPLTLLNEIGASLEDDSIEMRLAAQNFISPAAPGIEQVTDANFHEFAAYHDKQCPQIYWTSERIGRDLSRWSIFVLRAHRQIVGYVLISMWNAVQSEIFCLQAPDELQCEELIISAAKLAFEKGKTEVLYMADENSAGQKAALSVGFAATGYYKGFMVKRT